MYVSDENNGIGQQELKNKKEQLAFSYYLRREQQMQYCDRSASVSSSSRAASHQVTLELFRGIRLILSKQAADTRCSSSRGRICKEARSHWLHLLSAAKRLAKSFIRKPILVQLRTGCKLKRASSSSVGA